MIDPLAGEVARVTVRSHAGDYPVVIGSGLLDELPAALDGAVPGRRLAFVSDETVAGLHTERTLEACREAGLDARLFTFPAGEASKSRKSWSILTDEMLDAGYGRDSAVVAMGGGVTTDLGGFVAATYLRGVPVVQVPTTSLAMIDASVGGKTGVDVRAGKNLVGAFHAPALVLADSETLGTLDAELRAQGLVEAVKHGAIRDVEHLLAIEAGVDRLVDGEPSEWNEVVTRSVEIKADIVSRDEFEGGLRQVLNFGHTIGHALEAASEFALGHGSAVALGMLAEAEAGERLGVTEAGTRARLGALLDRLLPADLAVPSADAASDFLGQDKKAREGRARYVLLRRIGEVAEGDGWSHDLPDEVVLEVLKRAAT